MCQEPVGHTPWRYSVAEPLQRGKAEVHVTRILVSCGGTKIGCCDSNTTTTTLLNSRLFGLGARRRVRETEEGPMELIIQNV